MFKHATYILLSAILVTFGAANVSAQQTSAQGLGGDVIKESACVEELTRVQEQLDNLENFAGQLESCNEQGQLFNGSSCVDIAELSHEWIPNANNPLQLVLYSNGVEVKRVDVIKGHDGFSQTSADCPAGTTAQK